MPVLRRKWNETKPAEGDAEYLRDNEEVFYCVQTNEIFRNYDDYFEKIMLLNSTVWMCSLTGRSNLTYSEARECERKAKKLVRQFPKSLRAPILLVADLTMQFSISDLVDDVFDFILVRHFKGEEVEAIDESGTKAVWRECVVLEALAPQGNKPEPYDPEEIRYRVKCTDESARDGETWEVTLVQIRRGRSILTKDKLKLFLKQQIEHRDGLLKVKPDSLKKMALNAQFNTIFVGAAPLFEMSQMAKDRHAKLLERLEKKKESKPPVQKKEAVIKKKSAPSDSSVNKKNKSATIDKYFTKDSSENSKKKVTSPEKAKKAQEAREEFERIQKKMVEEAARKQEELEQCRFQYEEILKAQVMRDDLEMADQKLLPTPHPIHSIVADSYFGYCLVLAEFLHSFEHLLVDKNYSKQIAFPELTRAFSFREVNGPLATICSTLLRTVFSLQQEEQLEADMEFSYVLQQTNFRILGEHQSGVIRATKAAMFPKQYLSKALDEIPLTSLSLSEVLRLHLLAGGANVDDRASRHRVLQRGGYIPTDDPAFELCHKYPHILRFLGTHSFFQMGYRDIFRILKCLVEQILSFPSVRHTLQTRLDTAKRTRIELRRLRIDETRRDLNHKEEVKVETFNAKTKVEKFLEEQETLQGNSKMNEEGVERFKSKVQRELEEKIASMEKTADRAKQKHESTIEQLRAELFDMEIQFGSDRALRNYYLIGAVPALIVENLGLPNTRCFECPVKNIPELVNCETEKRKKIFKKIALEKTQGNDKENRADNLMWSDLNKTLLEKQTQVDLTGQRELLMCTGNRETCLVHGNPKRHRWFYFKTEEELNELIKSLNKRGYREMALKAQLESEKDLILAFLQRSSTVMDHLNIEDKVAYREKLLAETQAAFPNPNFHSNSQTDDLEEIIHMELCQKILALEDDITNGHLGNLKIANLATWQTALLGGGFDMQADQVLYGINKKMVIRNPTLINGHVSAPLSNETTPAELPEPEKPVASLVKKEEPESSDEGVASGAEDEALDENSFEMPGIDMGDTLEFESSSSDDEPVISATPLHKQKVKNLATAVLQIAQAVEERFFKQPFGVKTLVKDASVNEARLTEARSNFAKWTLSLMNATTYSQISMHMEIFHASIIWARSVKNSHCILCHKRGNPQLMLLCDRCNNGEHMYCMKPKMNNIPEGDWFCRVCLPIIAAEKAKAEEKKVSAKNRSYYYQEINDDDDDEINSVGSLGTNCHVCEGSIENEASLGCFKCNRQFHKDCCKNLPASKYSTRSWMCWMCVAENDKKEKAKKRRRRAFNTDSEDEDGEDDKNETMNSDEEFSANETIEPPKKRPKRKTQSTGGSRRTSNRRETPNNKKRSYRKNSDDDDSVSNDQEEAPKSRRSRRGDESFPFDINALYQLLEDIAHHDDSWPFQRPVQKNEVPDYYKIIKTPMDFAKIKSKLNLGDYTSNFDIMSDVQLVFANCDLYNLADTEIYKVGQSLEHFVAKRCVELKLPFRPSDMIATEIPSKR